MAAVFIANLLGHIPVAWPQLRRVVCKRCYEDHGFHNFAFIREKCPRLLMPGDLCVWVHEWLNEQVTSFTDSILSLQRAADSIVEAVGEWRDSRRKAEDCSGGFVTALSTEPLVAVVQLGKQKMGGSK